MPAFGLHIILNDRSIQPAECARAAEERGFESLFLGEHTHIPVRRESVYPAYRTRLDAPPGETPEALARRRPDLGREFWRMYDPLIALATAAAVTERIRLGTAICLVPERDPITLAKELATLDRLSNGRLLFGVGSGWNAEEMVNHGVDYRNRFRVLRERVLAMKAIWTRDEAEFHGEFVRFDPIWSDPKPVQPGGPPVLLGERLRGTFARVAEYCDGWIPTGPVRPDLPQQLEQLRAAVLAAGRDPAAVSVTVYGPRIDDEARAEDEVRHLLALGVQRVLFNLTGSPPRERAITLLDRYARFIERFA